LIPSTPITLHTGPEEKDVYPFQQVNPINVKTNKPFSKSGITQDPDTTLVKDVMTQNVVTTSPEDTIENAARIMTNFGISCLVVQSENQILGILTERDVLTRVVASGRDPKKVLVKEVMNNPIISAEPAMSIEAAVKTMIKNKIKKLPVVDDSEIVGIITMTDMAGLKHDLRGNNTWSDERQPLDINDLIKSYEGQNLEFKSSFRYCFQRNKVDAELEFNCLKTICAFLNASGGDLIIGVSDSNVILGIETDYIAIKKRNRDGFQNYLINQIAHKIGNIHLNHIEIIFHEVQGHEVCQVHVKASHEPAFLNHKGKQLFFVRTGNGSRPFNISEAVNYMKERWR
jgi:CBS domain-containing protein